MPWLTFITVLRHQYQLDAHYYIEHQLIPPLERVFNLVGANVASWYAEMPKVARPFMPEFLAPERRIADAKAGPSKPKFTIDEHFKSASCVVCGKATAQGKQRSPRVNAGFSSER